MIFYFYFLAKPFNLIYFAEHCSLTNMEIDYIFDSPNFTVPVLSYPYVQIYIFIVRPRIT